MDTPGPDVVKDSQQSHPNVTPKSAAFGSPLHTQESWTAPPRRRPAQQKPKASFLDEEDEQSDTHVTPSPREQLDGDVYLDSTSSDLDSGQGGQDNEVRDVFNQSPTAHAPQGAHMPPQSAQLAPESSMSGSSDQSSVFESLKKHPPTAFTSNNPPKIAHSQKPLQPAQTQKRALETRGTTDTEGKVGRKDTVPGPKTVSRKTLANSKVKLSALELEEENGAEKPDNHGPHVYDYSLPTSNSSSPAAAPAKKRGPPKKQAVKKPAPKPKANARETKTATRERPRNAKPAPATPVHQSPEAHSDEDRDEDMLPAEKPSFVTQAPHKANLPSQMKGRKLESENSSNEDQEQDVIIVSSDSTSSFPESDNADDQDFECSRKMTPSIPRRRTRATAVRSQAGKETNGKTENDSAARPNARRHDAQDDKSNVHIAENPKKQPKQPPKKTAPEKTQAVATGTAPNLESKKDVKSYGGKPKEKNSTSERKATTNRTAKVKSEIKQEAVVFSNADRAGRVEANKLGQTAELGNQTKDYDRKPNIVAFGLGGPKNNGRSHKTTVTTDSRSRVQQTGPADGERPASTKPKQTKGAQKSQKMQLNTAVQDGDSPTNDFIGLAKIGLSRAARASQPTVAEAVPDDTPIFNAETKTVVPDFDAEMTTLVDESGRGDASGEFSTGDFEADTAVEDAANVTVDSPEHQNHDMANSFEGKRDGGKVLKPPARADIEHLLRPEERTILGGVDANFQTRPKDVPKVIPRLTKRKLPDAMTVEERSPIRQALVSKMDPQSGISPSLRMNSTALNLPSEQCGRPVKKPRKGSLVGDTKNPWLGDSLDQRRTSGVDDRAQAWKKATEPYADSLGETMHKIVNTILRGLKTNEAAIGDVVNDYRNDGQRVVEKIAHKHEKERALITQQQEQNRLEYVQTYGEARRVAGTLLGKLESVDVDKTIIYVGKSTPTNRLKQLRQTITDA
ncbi:hypothetical protein SLS63_010220 [Diaporthe eres]|uniref:AT hook domain-containing protein n=1 Tax=Diaporthe eres TaxID=83184 RepID=A0ABR1NXG5_DIAER